MTRHRIDAGKDQFRYIRWIDDMNRLLKTCFQIVGN